MGGPLESDDGCLTSCGSSLWAQHQYINIGIVVDRMRLVSVATSTHGEANGCVRACWEPSWAGL